MAESNTATSIYIYIVDEVRALVFGTFDAGFYTSLKRGGTINVKPAAEKYFDSFPCP